MYDLAFNIKAFKFYSRTKYAVLKQAEFCMALENT